MNDCCRSPWIQALGMLSETVHPFIQNGRKAEKFREKHNIKFKSKEGLFVIFGYPRFNYQKGINIHFGFHNNDKLNIHD